MSRDYWPSSLSTAQLVTEIDKARHDLQDKVARELQQEAGAVHGASFGSINSSASGAEVKDLKPALLEELANGEKHVKSDAFE